MFEEHYRKLAVKVLDESLRIERGETITIETWNNGLPFARRVAVEAKRRGAIPLLMLEDEEAFVEAAKTIPEENLGKMGKHEYSMLSATDAYVFIPGPPIAVFTKALSPEKKSASTAYNIAWYEAAEKSGLRGVRLTFGYIGPDLAGIYGRRPEVMVAHLLRASLVDYRQIGELGNRIGSEMKDGSEVSVRSGGELKLLLRGEAAVEDGIVDSGDVSRGNNIAYVPPGRIQKEIDPGSVTGKIQFSSALTTWGRIGGISLSFADGMLQSISCKEGKDALQKLLAVVPPEKRRVSSIEVGLNPLLRYGYGQDRFVSGSVAINLPRLSAVAEKAALSVDGMEIVQKGRLKSG